MWHESILQGILDIPAENQTLEFKRMGDEKVVAKTIETVVAMANTDGGTIVLGIDDPEKTKLKRLDRVFGIEENLEVFDEIGRELQRIVPPLSGTWPPSMIEVEQTNKRVAILAVPKAVDSFRSINNYAYIRLEKGNHRLTAHEVVKFAYAKGFEKADRELVDVDFSLLQTEFFEEWKKARRLNGGAVDVVLEKTGLARRNDKGKLLPTIAAVLLFAEYPSDLMEVKCAIRVFQYVGTIETIGETPNLIGVPKTIQGPLIKQIADAHDFVLMLLRSGIRIPSGFKTEYSIPERALKEAITNAVIHRDYHMKRDIEVKIYEDRVEVDSPGLFPFNITRANIGWERAEGYRNDLLVKHLREFASPPNLDQNEGVRAMRHEMLGQHLYPPIFLTYPFLKDSVRVVLLNERRVDEWEKISAYLKESKYVNNEEARKVTRVVQRDKMSRMLKKWVKRGLLVQIVPPTGYIKDTKYRLPDAPEVRR
jgi:ATP-dependent DNA helicase RecG